MSIRQEWQKLVRTGELVRLEPLVGDPNSRTVLLTPEMDDVLTRHLDEGPEADRRSRLLDTMHGIVAGRRQVVCLMPYAARRANIGRLDPIEDSVFDIRCQDKPAVRVFCMFLERDVLLAATCRPRSVEMGWLDWLPLGDRHSKKWKEGVTATKREWAKFFPTYTPVGGENLDDYLSKATHECPRRRT